MLHLNQLTFNCFSYRKYIDENCKYKEGTLFGVSKIKGKYYIFWGGEETELDVQDMIYHYIMKQLYIYQRILIEITLRMKEQINHLKYMI